MKISFENVNAVEAEASPNMWYKRLRHLSEKKLDTLVKKALIKVAKGILLNPSDYCLFGKEHRILFNSSSTKKSYLLRLVHSNVCGRMVEDSLGGNRYFVALIDDASQKVSM